MAIDPLSLLVGFSLRFVQAALNSSLYVLIGLLVAGWMRAMMGPQGIRSMFQGGAVAGSMRAWVFALIVPVCSLGVLPILHEMRRAGVSRSPLLSFALVGAVFHPISLAYGLSILPFGLLSLVVLSSLVFCLILGASASYLLGEPVREVSCDDGIVPSGPVRLKAIVVNAASSLRGPLLRDLGIGLAGAGLLGALLSPEFLPPQLSAANPLSVPAMVIGTTPAHVLPERGIRTIAEMWARGQSTGAMVAWMIVGVGLTFGHGSWLLREFGGRSVIRVVLALSLIVVVSGLLINRAYPPRATEDLDTHIFDDYTSPFGHHAYEFRNTKTEIAAMATKLAPGWPVSCAVLVVLGVIGYRLRRSSTVDPFLAYLVPVAPSLSAELLDLGPGRRPVWDARISPRLLGLVGLLALVPGTIFGVAVYYPAPRTTFEEMQIVYADLFSELSAPAPRGALSFLERFEAHASKLRAGSWIRRGSLDPEAGRLSNELDARIRELRTDLESGRKDEARLTFRRLSDTFQECRNVYLNRRPVANPLVQGEGGR